MIRKYNLDDPDREDIQNLADQFTGERVWVYKFDSFLFISDEKPLTEQFLCREDSCNEPATWTISSEGGSTYLCDEHFPASKGIKITD